MKAYWLFATLLLTLLATSCTHSPVQDSASHASKQPEWIINPPTLASHRYGVGSAEILAGVSEARIRAKKSAMADIAKQIQVSISTHDTLRKELHSVNGKGTFTQNVTQAIQTRTPKMQFSFITVSDSYKDPAEQRVYILLDLNVTKEIQAMRKRIMALDEQIQTERGLLGPDGKTRVEDLRRIATLLIQLKERNTLQGRIRLLRPNASPIDTAETDNMVDLENQLLERIASIRIAINSAPDQPDQQDGLKGVIAKQLTDRGLTIVTQDPELSVVYDLSLDTIKKEDIYFGIARGQISLQDQSGRTIKSYQVNAKGVSVNKAQARYRTIDKLGSKLSRAILESLFK